MGRPQHAVTCSLGNVEGFQDMSPPSVFLHPPHKRLIPFLDKTSCYSSILGHLWPGGALAAIAIGSQWQAEITIRKRLKQWRKWEDCRPREAENKAAPRLEGLNVLGTPWALEWDRLGYKPPCSCDLTALHLVFSNNKVKMTTVPTSELCCADDAPRCVQSP